MTQVRGQMQTCRNLMEQPDEVEHEPSVMDVCEKDENNHG